MISYQSFQGIKFLKFQRVSTSQKANIYCSFNKKYYSIAIDAKQFEAI